MAEKQLVSTVDCSDYDVAERRIILLLTIQVQCVSRTIILLRLMEGLLRRRR